MFGDSNGAARNSGLKGPIRAIGKEYFPYRTDYSVRMGRVSVAIAVAITVIYRMTVNDDPTVFQHMQM